LACLFAGMTLRVPAGFVHLPPGRPPGVSSWSWSRMPGVL